MPDNQKKIATVFYSNGFVTFGEKISGRSNVTRKIIDMT